MQVFRDDEEHGTPHVSANPEKDAYDDKGRQDGTVVAISGNMYVESYVLESSLSANMPVAWESADVYTDELVSATELNRNSGAVLDKAQHGPVTITRNNEAYALIERSKMHSLINAKRTSDTLAHVFCVGTAKLLGRAVPENDPFFWVNAFDPEELGDLLDELKEIYRVHDSDSESLKPAVDALLHEWRETALALSDSSHRAAFLSHLDTSDEVPLTDPRQ